MTATTTRSDQEDGGDVVTSWEDAPTRTVSVGSVDFAYRELGEHGLSLQFGVLPKRLSGCFHRLLIARGKGT